MYEGLKVLQMLIDFTMSNYRSYKDQATLSLETGERLRKRSKQNTIKISSSLSLLKNLAIFGANGSGKSSVVDGLLLMKQLVTLPTTDISQQLPFFPFKLNNFSENEPTKFEINFLKNNYKYNYSFSYSQNEIKTEQLRVASGSKFKILFERKDGKILKSHQKQSSSKQNTRKNVLFLYSLQANNYAHAINVFDWFKNDLVVFGSTASFDTFDNQLMDNSKVKKELTNFLRASDVNILGITYRDIDIPVSQTNFRDVFNNSIRESKNFLDSETSKRFLFTVHKKFDSAGNVIGTEEIPVSAESTGTKRILMIALAIINSQFHNNHKTLVFDEFEEGLHFEMAIALVNLFNSEQNNNQFILTTHQLELLNSNLRVDQIYFAEKNYRGESDLYSLFDYSSDQVSRADITFSKRYIKGQFGAVPTINMEALQESLKPQTNLKESSNVQKKNKS